MSLRQSRTNVDLARLVPNSLKLILFYLTRVVHGLTLALNSSILNYSYHNYSRTILE